MQRISLGENSHEIGWLLETAAGQGVLATFHAKGFRPRCNCVAGGVEMYIGKRNNRYYLARLPNSGPLHHETCLSAETGSFYTGIDCYLPDVIREEGLRLVVRFDFAQRRGSELGAVGINGLLSLLVEQAGLNQWNTGSITRRSWTEVQAALQKAFEDIDFTEAGPACEQAYIPPKFEKTQSFELRNQAIGKLGNPGRPFLVLAPLRELRPSPYGWLIRLRHLPNQRFWISKTTGMLIEEEAAGRFFLDHPPRYALILAEVRKGRSEDSFNVHNAAILRTDSRYLPSSCEEDDRAADWLVNHDFEFVRPLRFDATWDRHLCNFIFPDHIKPGIGVVSRSDDLRSDVFGVLSRYGAAAVWAKDGWSPALSENISERTGAICLNGSR